MLSSSQPRAPFTNRQARQRLSHLRADRAPRRAVPCLLARHVPSVENTRVARRPMLERCVICATAHVVLDFHILTHSTVQRDADDRDPAYRLRLRSTRARTIISLRNSAPPAHRHAVDAATQNSRVRRLPNAPDPWARLVSSWHVAGKRNPCAGEFANRPGRLRRESDATGEGCDGPRDAGFTSCTWRNGRAGGHSGRGRGTGDRGSVMSSSTYRLTGQGPRCSGSVRYLFN